MSMNLERSNVNCATFSKLLGPTLSLLKLENITSLPLKNVTILELSFSSTGVLIGSW